MRILKFKKPNLYKILLYYSTIFSTILILGGFYAARSVKEIVSNLLFLPVVVFLWIVLIEKRKEARSKRKELDVNTKNQKNRERKNKI